MLLSYCVICDPGRVRDDNQDNVYCNGEFRRDIQERLAFRRSGVTRNSGLFAVADGMGGEAHGAQAALETVRALDTVDLAGGAEAVTDHLLARNDVICDLISSGDGRRMGATFAGLLIHNGMAHVINVGDSRVYLCRSSALEQLSCDHTAIRPMIDMGILTPEAARTHPDRHRLSQHLGIFPDEMVIEPHTVSGMPQVGDIFLLCSDGLTDMVDDTGIGAILRGQGTLPEKAEALFAAALRGGGKDNISVLLVEIESEEMR